MSYRPITEAEEELWFQEILKKPTDERPFIIEIPDESSIYKPIGDCEFSNFDWRSRKAEVGISIGEKSYWGHGYGTDAMRVLVNYGFNMLNLNRISLKVFSFNKRAIRSYEKVGFTVEGTLREEIYKDGKYVDVLVMGLLRNEWGK